MFLGIPRFKKPPCVLFWFLIVFVIPTVKDHEFQKNICAMVTSWRLIKGGMVIHALEQCAKPPVGWFLKEDYVNRCSQSGNSSMTQGFWTCSVGIYIPMHFWIPMKWAMDHGDGEAMYIVLHRFHLRRRWACWDETEKARHGPRHELPGVAPKKTEQFPEELLSQKVLGTVNLF